jgi:hypothetical protein
MAAAQRGCNSGGCYERLADGTLLEWGSSYSCLGGDVFDLFNFPYAFPNGVWQVTASMGSRLQSLEGPTIGADVASNAQFLVTCPAEYASNVGAGPFGFRFLAIGD